MLYYYAVSKLIEEEDLCGKNPKEVEKYWEKKHFSSMYTKGGLIWRTEAESATVKELCKEGDMSIGTGESVTEAVSKCLRKCCFTLNEGTAPTELDEISLRVLLAQEESVLSGFARTT